MNKARRAQLEALLPQLEDVKDALELLREEEQDYFDNMPEGLQSSERGEAAENAVSAMDEAIGSLDEAFEAINTAAD